MDLNLYLILTNLYPVSQERENQEYVCVLDIEEGLWDLEII